VESVHIKWRELLPIDAKENFGSSEKDALLDSAVEKMRNEEKKMVADPKQVYIIPLNRRPFFPGMAAPIVIEPGPFYEVLKMVAKSKEKYIGLFLTKDEDDDVYDVGFDELYKVGTLARVLRIIPTENEGAQVVLSMEKRITLSKPLKRGKFLRAHVSVHKENPIPAEMLKAYSISIISTIKELLKLNPLFKEELQVFLGHSDFTQPGKLADFAVALTTASREDLQDVLQTFDLQKRVEKTLILLKKELDLNKIQVGITDQIEANISKSQREFFLREQLKTIRRELGVEKDERSYDLEKFDQRIEERQVPDDVMEVINEEREKLMGLEAQSSEYSVSRGYLDWLTVIPWGLTSDDSHDLALAEKILEKEHHGLEDIKQRILEFIGVGKLAGGIKGSIICLVGPPGVGKTSIGRSIAHALNRKFYRFSVGGMRDEAEIKGHRRTYIGSMPGKLIQALKTTKTMNPVIMLDEVDKIGSSYQGDPASALLEVLDPEQNKDFQDHYLDVRCDLSEVLFIVTANIEETIPEPLIDRMDVLRLSGYILKEKVQIAKKFLIPRNRKAMGLKASHIKFTDKGLAAIINGYARESGVRNFENYLKKIMRKVAVKIVRGEEALARSRKSKEKKDEERKALYKNSITVESLSKYVGKPVFTSDRFYDRTPVGVCMGLAWTSMGGATLYIEVVKVSGEKTEMKLTGQAGDVMKESAQIAWTYLHSVLHKYAPEHTFFEKSQVHMHIPEGATPKDGPSAGITMVTALISLLTDTSILEDLGMTGELTLTGRVLPIGGLKEKLIAARRSGLHTLIFPKDNLRDYEEMPDHLKDGLTVYFVEHYDEIFQIAFPTKKLHHGILEND
jgi:ATP-dependent Lon protease